MTHQHPEPPTGRVLVAVLILTLLFSWVSPIPAAASRGANSASQQGLATVGAFLHPPYAVETLVSSIFDHHYPYNDYATEEGQDNHIFVSWQGLETDCPEPNNQDEHGATCGQFSYDGHGGIDYVLRYSPIYAAADVSEVVDSGWVNPQYRLRTYGLRIRLRHHVEGVDFYTLYGHLSATNIPPECRAETPNCPYGTMIGISGNTGTSTGPHLHFEVQRTVNDARYPIDPYGWEPAATATWTNDPWRQYGQADSLWSELPNVTLGNQTLEGSDTLPNYTPMQNPENMAADLREIIDNGHATLFTQAENCWTEGNIGGGLAYNGDYLSTAHDQGATAETTGGSCWAQWHVPDTQPSGDYDVYVRVPARDESSIDGVRQWSTDQAIYRVISDGREVARQIISQHQIVFAINATYPETNPINQVVDAGWVFIGTYHFDASSGSNNNYIQLGNYTGESGTVQYYDDNHVIRDGLNNPIITADAVAFVRLKIDPTPTPPPTVTPTATAMPAGTLFETQIAQSSDDAGMNTGCGYTTNDNEIYFGECSSGAAITSGFRFSNIPIPRRSEILSAHIEFTVDGPYWDEMTLAFYGESNGSAIPFTLTDGPSNRPLSSANTLWFIPSSDYWQLGDIRQSPSLANIVQETVNRSDWESGSAMAFIVTNVGPTSGANRHRRVIGYDRPDWYPGNQYGARLVIRYNPALATPTPPSEYHTPTPWVITSTPTATPPQPPPPPCNCIFGCGSSSEVFQTGKGVANLSRQTRYLYEMSEFADLLYQVRDEMMSQTSEGQHYTSVYYQHSAEIARLLLADQALYDHGHALLVQFQPGLQALVDETGATTTISGDQIAQMQAFLDALSAVGSPELQNTIATERTRQPLEELEGMSMKQAWVYLSGYQLKMLAPLKTSNPYMVRSNKTIPIQFSLIDYQGNFIVDNSITLRVNDASGAAVIAPVGISSHSDTGLYINGSEKKYHYNLNTTGWAPGSYNLEIFYNGETQGESFSWIIQIRE